jgi:uncharacterized integral membrane protein (TIGR00697 family)
MLQVTTAPLVQYLQSLSPELVTILTLLLCYACIIIMTKFWGKEGLYIYSVIAIITCNMQVLKAMEFTWYSEPIALGTIVYASTFLASDVITELYGSNAARKSIYLGFAGSILLLLLMILALGLKPLNITNSSDNNHFNEAHQALSLIFSPNAALLVASLTAYVASQLTDIFIFSKLKNLTKNAYLWLRTFCSITIAALVDAIIFNILAWMIFSPQPIGWHSLIFTYIIGAYVLQMFVALFNIPTFYLLLKTIRKQ